MDGRWVVAFMLGLAFVLAIGASMLPRVGPHEIMSQQVNLFLDDHLPRPVEWERVDISIDPPRLVVQGVTAGVARNGEPVIRAAKISLEAYPESLRRGMVRLSEVSIDDLALRLEWSGEGWRWLEERERETDPPVAAASQTGSPGAATPPAETFPPPTWKVEKGRVWIVDQGADPPREFELREVVAEMRPNAGGAVFSASGSVLGGRIEGHGEGSAADVFAANLDLKNVDLAPLAVYAKAVERATGRVSGSVALEGKGDSSWRIDANLEIQQSDLQVQKLGLKGAVKIRVAVRPAKEGNVRGNFRIDASDAALDMDGIYKKPPGKRAEVSGDFRIDDERQLEIGSFHLSIGGSGEERP